MTVSGQLWYLLNSRGSSFLACLLTHNLTTTLKGNHGFHLADKQPGEPQDGPPVQVHTSVGMAAQSGPEQEPELLSKVFSPATNIPRLRVLWGQCKWLIQICFALAQKPRLPNHKYLLDESCLGCNYLTQAMSWWNGCLGRISLIEFELVGPEMWEWRWKPERCLRRPLQWTGVMISEAARQLSSIFFHFT